MKSDHKPESASALTSQIQTAIEQFGTKISLRVQDAENRGEHAYAHVRDALHDLTDDLSELAANTYIESKRATARGERAIVHEIKEKPFLALLAAGALGFGIATLIHSGA